MKIASVMLGVFGSLLVGACKDQSASAGVATTATPGDLPDLAVSVDEIDKVSITNADKGEVVFEKRTGTWAVTKPVQAPANPANVKQLLDSLKELKAKEVISSAPSADQTKEFQFDRDKAVHVVAFKGADKKLDVSFGKSSARGQTAMVDGKPAIYTVSGYSSALYARDVKGWVENPETAAAAQKAIESCPKWCVLAGIGVGRHCSGGGAVGFKGCKELEALYSVSPGVLRPCECQE